MFKPLFKLLFEFIIVFEVVEEGEKGLANKTEVSLGTATALFPPKGAESHCNLRGK